MSTVAPMHLLRQAYEAFCHEAKALADESARMFAESERCAAEAVRLTALQGGAQRNADAIAALLPPTAEPPAANMEPALLVGVKAEPTPKVEIDVSALQESLNSGRKLGITAPLRELPDPRPIVAALLERLGMLDPLTKHTTLLDVDALFDACAAPLADLPQRLNLLATTLLTARLRRCQEACIEHGFVNREVQIAGLLRRLTSHSEETRPGFVHGLARNHEPRHGSWTGDAYEAQVALVAALDDISPPPPNLDDQVRTLTERCKSGELGGPALAKELKALISAGLSAADTRLVNLAMPHAEHLDGRALAPLRKAIQKLATDTSDGDLSPLPDNWLLFDYVRGKSVIIVGGDPRVERCQRLVEVFGFSDVDWETHSPRRVQALASRMRAGKGIAVLLQPFIDHKTSNTLFAAATADFPAVMSGGYGINQIRRGLERYLGKEIFK